MTISQIGSKGFLCRRPPLRGTHGFSFVEVMITTAILSFGVVMIYRAFFISLNYLNHVSYRLYAMTLLDNKITWMHKRFEATKEIPFTGRQEVQTVRFGPKEILFRYETDFKDVEQLSGICQADISLSWSEGTRDVKISRTAYIGSKRP